MKSIAPPVSHIPTVPKPKGRKHRSFFFWHRGVAVYFVEKYGIAQSYWYSTEPGVHAEPWADRKTSPQFDIRTLPHPFTLKEDYDSSLGAALAYARMRHVHRALMTAAIDAGVWFALFDFHFWAPGPACPKPVRRKPRFIPADRADVLRAICDDDIPF